jgi:hypothetical protein
MTTAESTAAPQRALDLIDIGLLKPGQRHQYTRRVRARLTASAARDLDVLPAGTSDCFLGMCSLARRITAY